jgi:hypothetical protein
MALRARCMLVGALAVQYAVALRCSRRASIAQITAAACATATAARAADVPMLGRFARNEGAKEFVGDWRLETTTGAKGRLVFKGDGDTALYDGERLLGESAVPWKYSGRQGIVSVSFTLDLPTISDDVLISTARSRRTARCAGRSTPGTRRWARGAPARRRGSGSLSRRGSKSTYCS